MRSFAAVLFSVVLSVEGVFAQSGAALLEKSMAYHDPGDLWGRSIHRFLLCETRPGAQDRFTAIELNNPAGRFSMRTERDGRVIEASVQGDGCTATINGSHSFSDSLRTRYRLTCDGIRWLRGYYGYLLGQPIKLSDPGTQLHGVEETLFVGREVQALKVSYDEGIGEDTWYYYFDRSIHSLVGTRFYHDERANDGEYIVFKEEITADGVRLPKRRTWYTNAEDKLLGADIIERYERLDAE